MKKYTIGEFARLCQISPQTLRYYDKIGLLKPFDTSELNNYRFYTKKQILDLLLIQKMRFLGFSSMEIKTRLKTVEPNDIKEFYDAKIEELTAQLNELYYIEQNIHISIDVLSMSLELEKFESKGPGPLALPQIKNIPDRLMLSVIQNRTMGERERLKHFWEVQHIIEEQKIRVLSPFLLTFYDSFPPGPQNPVRIGLAIEIHPHDKDRLPHWEIFPGSRYLTQIFKGDTIFLYDHYAKLVSWAGKEGIKPAGPVSFSYLVPTSTAKSPEKVVVELQIPVEN